MEHPLAFEPGQAHELHTHDGIDKMYHVLEGGGVFLLVLAVLAPAP